MKLEFIGTGAADFNIAKRVEGEFFRRWSCTLVDDSLLIDPGPHVKDYLDKNGCPELLDKVEYVLVTHAHGDHLDMDTVKMLVEKNPNIKFWGGKASAGRIRELSENVTEVEFNKPFECGKYTVTPYHGNHSPMVYGEQSYLYVIDDGEKKMFYATDTSWLPSETWIVARKTHQFDCIIMEVTLGDVEGDYRIFEHNNIRMVEIMLETFRKTGFAKPECKVIATHIAKYPHESHEKLSERLAGFDMITAYDGYTIEI